MDYVVNVIVNTSQYWNLPAKTQFHHCIAQYVTKMVKFNVSQKIRRNLYLLLGDPYDKYKFDNSSNQDLINCGLNQEQITTLKYISSIIDEQDTLDNNLERLSKVVGFGHWTIKSIRLMMSTNEQIFLYEDSYIRTRLSELYGMKTLNQANAKKIGSAWNQYQSILSKFLWRIKKEGIQKLTMQISLTRDDFL
jgi:3-methyladenine DNA glycosylase/8-oxoguanine DNA glycosylase